MNRRAIPWLGLALWAAAAAVLIPLAGRNSEVQSTDPALVLPRGAEVTRALAREREAFPGNDTPVAVVVYVRDSGITAQDKQAVDIDREAFASLARDHKVDAAVPSDDGKALLLSFLIAGDGPRAEAIVQQIKDRLADTPAGLSVAVTGSAGMLADASEAFGGVESTLLLAAAGVVAVLLLITYRSPVLWLVPLLSVALASQLASGIVYLLGRYAGITVTVANVGIMLVLIFGVGTDYALLLIARYREELRRNADRYTAMAIAWRRSFPAILASAATVMAGLLTLVVARMNDVHVFGPVAAAGIAVAFAVMTTLLPAILVILGRWVFWPFVPRHAPGEAADPVQQHGIWHRLAGAIGRRPRVIWTVTAVVLATMTLGVLALRLEQPADAAYTIEVGSVTGQKLVARHYPSGTPSPARIIAAVGKADEVVAAAAAVDGVAKVTRGGTSPDGRWAVADAVLADPPDSAAAKATIDRLREATHAVPGADALVGGQTATRLDIERTATRDNSLLMPLILIVVFAVLVLLLRALVAPLLLAASVLLSYAAAMGVAALVLQAIGYPGMEPTLPLWGYIFLVTLGVDYTIFLMTRAREEVAKDGNRDGVLAALTVTGGVITSAGVVLAATFATLVVLPAVTALQIGLIVAVGVLIDTVIVRTLLVPTLAVDLGPRVWWPSRLSHRPTGPLPRRDAVDLAA